MATNEELNYMHFETFRDLRVSETLMSTGIGNYIKSKYRLINKKMELKYRTILLIIQDRGVL